MTRIAIRLITAFLLCAPMLAWAAGASPLPGSWAVDVSRLPIAPAVRPKSVTITFADAGKGKLMMEVDIVDSGGSEIHSTGVATLDGVSVPVQGSPEADIFAMKQPQPGVLVVSLGKNGLGGSTRIYAVAVDGKTMVETAAYFGKDGLPIMRTNYFSRIP